MLTYVFTLLVADLNGSMLVDSPLHNALHSAFIQKFHLM